MDATPGHRQVLEALKRKGPSTARELAAVLGVGPVVVRAHLRSLLERGLVAHEVTRQPVGRPTRRFRLTPAAAAHFPQQYSTLAVELAEALRLEAGPGALQRTFARWEQALFERLDRELPRDPDARMRAMVEHQSRHGFMASQDRSSAGPAILERNCPIAEMAVRHPEICRHEASLFGRLLNRPVTLAACQALGSPICMFRIEPQPQPQEEPEHAGTPA